MFQGKYRKIYSFSNTEWKKLDNGKTFKYRLKFIGSNRFMSRSLWTLIDNLSDGLYNDKCIDCKSYLKYYMLIKNDELIFRCFGCKEIIIKISIKIWLKDLETRMNFAIKIFIIFFIINKNNFFI